MDTNSDVFDHNNYRMDDDEIIYEEKPPKVINNYLLGQKLGKGSYAKVKEAINLSTKEIVAIKICNKKALRKVIGGYEGVLQEIEILKELSKHPNDNVIQLYEAFTVEEKNKLYLVIELATNGSLEDLINHCKHNNIKLSISQIRKILSDILNGVEYIHSLGIIHKDLKPSNILISSDGTAKISDFGVADVIGDNDIIQNTKNENNNFMMGSSSRAGTPAYQPPEEVREKETDEETDFSYDAWSIGIITYILVVGVYPFDAENVFDLFENISKCSYTIPDNIDPLVSDLIKHILVKDPKERYTIEEIKNHDFFTNFKNTNNNNENDNINSENNNDFILLPPFKSSFKDDKNHLRLPSFTNDDESLSEISIPQNSSIMLDNPAGACSFCSIL